MTPADKLNQAIKAFKLANDNVGNWDLYCILMHRACVLKLEHAKMVGAAAEKIILEKYGNWIFDAELKASAFKMAISEKFGISADVVVSDLGITIDVYSIISANTLFKAFRRHKPLMKSNAYNSQTMFIPVNDNFINLVAN